jgi:hypothetical protein
MEYEDTAQQIMREFAASTGLSETASEPRRYLWTDAFAVCNYLGYFSTTGEQAYLDLATKLVDQVHEHLGKHRHDSSLTGWLSGLPEAEARLHPTCAGLRIGKPLDERKINEPQDETLEWQQDGQYFHYLTRWMHALNRVGIQTGNPAYNRWASELAKTAHRAFVHLSTSGGAKKIYWKMSIDLSRPLVLSMGHHDPLDGLVTYQQLQSTAELLASGPALSGSPVSLQSQIEEFSAMCNDRNWATSDELGIGCMLSTACHLAQLITNGRIADVGLLEALLSDSVSSLHSFAADKRLGYPAEYRLAFREFGLAIGLKAINNIAQNLRSHPRQFKNTDRLSGVVTMLEAYSGLHQSIVNFWLAPPSRTARTWLDHADINNVMLATSLAPNGYLQA